MFFDQLSYYLTIGILPDIQDFIQNKNGTLLWSHLRSGQKENKHKPHQNKQTHNTMTMTVAITTIGKTSASSLSVAAVVTVAESSTSSGLYHINTTEIISLSWENKYRNGKK